MCSQLTQQPLCVKRSKKDKEKELSISLCSRKANCRAFSPTFISAGMLVSGLISSSQHSRFEPATRRATELFWRSRTHATRKSSSLPPTCSECRRVATRSSGTSVISEAPPRFYHTPPGGASTLKIASLHLSSYVYVCAYQK